jgi:hypothetical protein
MGNLRRSSAALVFAFIFFVGCVSTKYKVIQSKLNAVGLLITTDRILLECEDLHAGGGDRPGSFGFMIHMLDEEKTVLTGIWSLQVSKTRCQEMVRDIERIMKRSKQVYIAGVSDLREPRTMGMESYTFPKLGTYRDNGRSMQWFVLKGEDGSCVTAYEGAGNPCPWNPMFPKETMPF